MRINIYHTEPDGHSFEVSEGVFCRTVHDWELKAFLSAGWVKNESEAKAKEEKPKRQRQKKEADDVLTEE